MPIGGGRARCWRRGSFPRAGCEGVRRRFDPLGAVTVTGALLLLVYAISKAPEAGWGAARTLALLAASVALLVAFVAIERGSRRR